MIALASWFAIPMVRNAAIGLAIILAVISGLVWLRHDAASDAVKDLIATQAVQTQEIRKTSDEVRARVDAGSDGAALIELQRSWSRD